MKYTIALLMILLILSSMSTTSTPATMDQGFEWGYNTGDRFYFILNADEIDGFFIFEEVIYIEANSTTAIPNSITNWTDIPTDNLNFYYSNGTPLGTDVNHFLGVLNFGLPIGNWTFLSELAEDTIGLSDIIFHPENPFFWAYHWEDDNWTRSDERWDFASNYSIELNVDYLKLDGFISRYFAFGRNRTTGEGTAFIEIERMHLEKYRDFTYPDISHPEDIEYTFGQTGHSITWSATDEFLGSYRIFKHGLEVVSGDWNSPTEEFTISVDGLDIGLHHYTIDVIDFRGHVSHDEVYVRVSDPTQDYSISVSLVGGIGIIILGAVVVLRKR